MIKISEDENEQAIPTSINNDQELKEITTQEEIEEEATSITQKVLDGQDSNYFPL